LVHERQQQESNRLEYEKQLREKDRILKRIMNSNLRMAGSAFRQAYQWSLNTAEEERVLFAKMRGAMRRILDSNTRLLSAGYNKLVEESKSRKKHIQNKLRNILKSLTDKDTAFTLAAYNSMKARKMMLEGVGLEGQLCRKLQIRLIRKITDKTCSLCVSAINGLKEFLVLSREGDESCRLKYELEMRLKDRILRRIISRNLRMTSLAFRQSKEWTFVSADNERLIANKQRGILNRILDSNWRLLSAGYNKLVEESKYRKKVMQRKIKGLINSLTNKDMAYRRTAYNSMKQRCQMLNGQGVGTAQMKRVSLIKRMTNQSQNLQVMAVNSLRQFLVERI
jgi:Pyruvate/2-oxoacid:ferredoxin oxidoreductase gamma subunit